MLATGADLDLPTLETMERSSAKLRLFCFPFAGGGASTYLLWGTRLPSPVEVCPIQLPGRDARASEAPIGSLVRLAVSAATEISPLVDTPYALFGHGMGALLAFEVSRALRRAQRPLPITLLVSECHSPQSGSVGVAAIDRPTDLDFVERVRKAGALPADILRDPERLAQSLPVLRADLEASADYAYGAERPFDFPITAFRARNGEVSEAQLQQWGAETTAAFEQLTLPGDRFYIHSRPDPLLAHLGSRLRRLIAVPASDR